MTQPETPPIQIPSAGAYTLPAAPAAERTYLAALVAGQLNSELLTLDPNEFTLDQNELVYAAAAKRLLDAQPLAPALLIEDLASEGNLQLVGGAAFVEELAQKGALVSIAVADECAKTIREKSVARELQKLGESLLQNSGNELDKVLARIDDIRDTCQRRLATAHAYRYSSDEDLDAILGSIEWLWDKWILRGYVTAIVAEQETGKSNLSLDLCGRLLTGASWPDGSPTGVPADCRLLWIDTEMALGAMVQRLNDWDLPRGRFILPENPLQLLQLDKPADWQWIEAAIARFRPPLLIIDALSGAHRSEEKDNDAMKVILQNLSALAQKYKMAVVIVHHIRKAGVGEPDYPISLARVRGASAITQFCRSVLALGIPDKSQPDLRRLDSIKSNFARKPEPLGYEISDKGLLWGEAPDVPKSANPIQGAKAFLMEFLGNGRRYSEEVKEASESESLSWRTIERASKELHVERKREMGKEGRWYWQLPGRKTAIEQFDDNARGIYEEE